MESFIGAWIVRNRTTDDSNNILMDLSIYSWHKVLEELGRNGKLVIPDVYSIIILKRCTIYT